MNASKVGEVPPTSGNHLSVEIDLVSDSDDDENVKFTAAVVVHPPPGCPPQQENRRPEQTLPEKVPVQVTIPTRRESAATGCPPKVVEWSRCLVCDKGFLAMCRQPKEALETMQQVIYLLQQCMGVPPRKCKKVAKKILKESEAGGRAPVSLFCPTHESMVVEANKLSVKVAKLTEDLETKEETLRTAAAEWISGTEDVVGICLIVRNAVMGVTGKTKGEGQNLDRADLKPSRTQPSQTPVSNISNNTEVHQASPRRRPVEESSNQRPQETKAVRNNVPETKTSTVSDSRDRVEPRVGNETQQRSQNSVVQQSRETRRKSNEDTTKPLKIKKQDVIVLSGDDSEDNDDDGSDDSATCRPESTKYPTNTSAKPRPASADRETRDASSVGLRRGEAEGIKTCPSYSAQSLNTDLLNSTLNSSRLRSMACLACPEVLPTASDRDNHYRVAHSDGINFRCYICKSMYSSIPSLKSHLTNMHNPINPFECAKCGLRYGQEHRLKVHMLTHITSAFNNKKNSIAQKKTGFGSLSMSKRLVMNSLKSRNYRNIQQQQLHRSQSRICKYCKRTFPDSRSLDLHVERNHWIYCDKCEFHCESGEILRQHISRRHCDDLSPRYDNHRQETSRRFRLNHRRDNRKETNTNDKTYSNECDGCGLDFNSRYELMKHTRRCGRFAHL